MLAAASILLPDVAVHKQMHVVLPMRLPTTGSFVRTRSDHSFLLPGMVCYKAVAPILLPGATVPFQAHKK